VATAELAVAGRRAYTQDGSPGGLALTCFLAEAIVPLTGLAGLIGQLAGYWHLASQALMTPGGLLALAAIALTGMLVALIARNASITAALSTLPMTRRAAALREKSWLARFQRQLDPDAAGRARPRAPSAVPAAA
jgi:hypothetical protein